ncbi:type II toxin-antitoxin system PemK/MazF family toxin [Dermatophilus congolensis]|nr:type II toxin-antitoxin system PemK/MazF family toxin [Dermatophilus congolensis]
MLHATATGYASGVSFNFQRLGRELLRFLLRFAGEELQRRTENTPPEKKTQHATTNSGAPENITYSPNRNGRPDPGEVVWAWVPFEEDPSQGKDRPVLVLSIEGNTVHALQLTSKDHDRDAAQEARAGRFWMDIGTGAWDRQGRPSEVRLNRLLALPADSIRREGAALDRDIFESVVAASAKYRH